MHFISKFFVATPLLDPPKEITRTYSQHRIIIANMLRARKISSKSYNKHIKELNLTVKEICKANDWRDITF